MKPKRTFRVTVMKNAWQLRRTTKQAWRLCIIKAWQLYRLAKAMRKGVVNFYYQKLDGTIRKASGTIYSRTVTPSKPRKVNYATFGYFDIGKGAFRCFKIENFIGII